MVILHVKFGGKESKLIKEINKT